MSDFFLTLKKIFELEKRKNFLNLSVSGGFQNFTNLVQSKLSGSGIPPEIINLLVSSLAMYDQLSVPDRKQTIDLLIKWLETDPTHNYFILEKLKGIFDFQNKGKISDQLPRQDNGLYADITTIRGIGEKNSKIFHKLGVYKIYDLLRYYPRRYQDYSKLVQINKARYGEEISLIGRIVQPPLVRNAKNRKLKIIESAISDDTGIIRLTWFNKPFLTNQLKQGMSIIVSGTVDVYHGRLVINNPEWERIDSDQLNTNRIVPIYPLSSGITQRQIRSAVHSCINIWGNRIKEFFPDKLLLSENLCQINDAILQIHFPKNEDSLKCAQDRLAFEEIFFLQLGVFIQKKNWTQARAQKFTIDDDSLKDTLRTLPFELTEAQKKAFHDIRIDLQSGRPMNRLLQGDVGSGKTIVSQLAVEIITRTSSQAAVMAPTAILAEQHFRTFSDFFVKSGKLEKSEIALLLGSTTSKERKKILDDLMSGQIKIIIGTHTLIEEPVGFRDLKLTVIDEQHRFGVAQRAMLRKKGESPHLLVMTATPIPRSLAMTIYGDLDVSTIDEMPVGRKTVKTIVQNQYDRELAYGKIAEHLINGCQAFIIYPLIESDDDDNLAVMNEYKRLSQKVFPNHSVGLMHGKLKPAEKDSIMRDFRDNKFEILVSTTVIEVGVDIPNATVVLIEGANRFGLAQLHQIRGRVGRNDKESLCILIPDNDDALENERLQAMTKTNNGFILADYDLKQRGPGEFLGSRQSGYVNMRFANITDINLIERCRSQTMEILKNDPNLIKPENNLLRTELTYYWPEINSN